MATRHHAKLADAIQETAGQPLDQRLLLSLVGYNCRRAYLAVIPRVEERLTKFALRKVDFTVLSLLNANPHMTQKRLSQAVNVSPPNLAILLNGLEERGLVMRQRNPLDKRYQSLVLTSDGAKLCAKAEKAVTDLERESTAMLSDEERATLVGLLQKIYLPPDENPD